MDTARIALIGDYDASAKAHQAIPSALALASTVSACQCDWLHTSTLDGDLSDSLSGYSGIWCVPASPYANTRGALNAIRFARETRRAFLGTCGGFQHALMEYAEAVWGVTASHAELDPDATDPVIAPLTCSLVEQSGAIYFAPASRLASIYGSAQTIEEYHCRYGLNPRYTARLTSGPLRIAARDAAGEVRAIELERHPFFIATLFQPERSAFSGRVHPLIRSFVAAVHDRGRVHAVATDTELRTPNLILVPKTRDQALAQIAAMPAEHRAQVSPVWLERVMTMATVDLWTFGFTILRADRDEVVGGCGFTGPPDSDGFVEIAYGIDPPHQGQGYATEAAGAMVEYAFRDPRVHIVCAHTLPAANASTRVLTKSRFRFVGPVIHPDDGDVWRWERHRDD